MSDTDPDLFLYAVMGVVAAVGCLAGGYTGAVNSRRSFNISLWVVLLIPLISFIISGAVAARLFPTSHDLPFSHFLGSLLMWHFYTLPTAAIAAAFGWAATWLFCYLFRLIRTRR